MKTTLLYLVLGAIMGIGLLQVVKQPVEAKPAVEVVDHTYCRAKFNNFLMRFEELNKPEAERYQSYREYMTSECVK